MPATRKSSRLSGGTNKQSTLSFNHRVTKNVPKSAKDSFNSPSAGNQVLPEEKKPGKPKVDEADEIGDTEVRNEQPAPQTLPVPDKSEVELRAEKISNAAVERYWHKVEAERVAKPVHQQSLSTGEKVLRYFDVSSQYGPCIGMSRRRRWQRAEKLGLNPPVEVLAVLLKEEAKGDGLSERAHMDDIMNSTAIGTS